MITPSADLEARDPEDLVGPSGVSTLASDHQLNAFRLPVRVVAPYYAWYVDIGSEGRDIRPAPIGERPDHGIQKVSGVVVLARKAYPRSDVETDWSSSAEYKSNELPSSLEFEAMLRKLIEQRGHQGCPVVSEGVPVDRTYQIEVSSFNPLAPRVDTKPLTILDQDSNRHELVPAVLEAELLVQSAAVRRGLGP